MLKNVNEGVIVFTLIFWGIVFACTCYRIWQLSQSKKSFCQRTLEIDNKAKRGKRISRLTERKMRIKRGLLYKSPVSYMFYCMENKYVLNKKTYNSRNENYNIQIIFYEIAGTRSEKIEKINKNMIVIGRNEKVDINIRDNMISRYHAEIIYKKNGVFIKDCNSRNHTYVGGEKIQAGEFVKIDKESIIQIGQTIFQIESNISPSVSKEE